MSHILLYLNRLAKLLKPIRLILVVFTFFALLLTAYSLLVHTAFTLNMLEPSIVASLWGMLLLACTELFQYLPEPVLPKDSFLQRMLGRCKIFFFTFLALVVLFVSVLLIWLSLRLLII